MIRKKLKKYKKSITMYIYVIAEFYNNIHKARISSNGNEQTSGISSKCTKRY